MPAPKCPFQTPIIAGDFACRMGQMVTARNTPQVHCRSEPSLELCRQVYEHLKKVGLPAFGMEDDLVTTPHSIYQKIQSGGLLGLQELSGIQPEAEGRIADLADLLEHVTDQCRSLDQLPYADLVPRMQAHQAKRRRSKT